MKLTIENARNIIVEAQKFQSRAKTSTLDVINQLGYVQIDTISVVERAHHHNLWTRNNRYQKSELNQLLESRKLIEYWSHAASYLPVEQYRYVLPRMLEYRSSKSHWFKVDPKIKVYVIDRIKSEGPLRASDFESFKKSSGWFDWKPAKKALEQHFMSGTLMVQKREGF